MVRIRENRNSKTLIQKNEIEKFAFCRWARGRWGGARVLKRVDHRTHLIIMITLDPQDNILWDAAILITEERKDVVFAVPQRPVHADECRLRKRTYKRMQLRVVRVTFLTCCVI